MRWQRFKQPARTPRWPPAVQLACFKSAPGVHQLLEIWQRPPPHTQLQFYFSELAELCSVAGQHIK